ncbi:MAG: hypothetical protein EOP36_12740 [Rubrivivax sp.]|nr:MAG: hypothetical protein EOP36_12740 [Rubrivivax sp.]
MSIISRWASQHQAIICIVLGALAALACVLWWDVKIAMSFDVTMGTEKPLELFIQVVGTVVTTLGVLFSLKQSREAKQLALRQEDKAARELLERASMVAAGLLPLIKRARDVANDAQYTLNNIAMMDLSYEPAMIRTALERLESEVFDLCDRGTPDLVPLPNNCAHRLHRGAAALRDIRVELREAIDFEEANPFNRDFKPRRGDVLDEPVHVNGIDKVPELIEQIADAVGDLWIAEQECTKAAFPTRTLK